MSEINRRDFLKTSLLAAAGAGVAGAVASRGRAWAQPAGANGDLRVAVVGLGGKGTGTHVGQLSQMEGVRIVALCDADTAHIDRALGKLRDTAHKPETFTDVRRVIDHADIDAVTVATPNHWHALIAIWACQAGKDVYVEKPVCQTVWEGRQMVKAARKYGRIVQSGTQNRSDTGLLEVAKLIHEGKLGAVKWQQAIWFKARNGLGAVDGPQQPPATVDYNLFCGPAPLDPIMRENLHYDWHWFWNTGNGEMGNLGIHQADVARWLGGFKGLPRRVMSVGGRFVWNDYGDSPNLHFAILEYEDGPIIVQTRSIAAEAGSRNPPLYEASNGAKLREANIVQCEGGYFLGGRRGGAFYDNDGNRQDRYPGDGGETHMANWVECVRSRKQGDLRAEIEEGHISTSMCLFANISYQLGELAAPGTIAEAIGDHPEVQQTLTSVLDHMRALGLDPEKDRLRLGPWLELDGETERVKGEGYLAQLANAMARRNDREPFVVPEQV